MARRRRRSDGLVIGVLAVGAFTVVTQLALSRAGRSADRRPVEVRSAAPYQSEVVEAPGTAVEILVDVSGSMAQPADGTGRPRAAVARAALERMLAATEGFSRRRPGYPLLVGVIAFNSTPRVMLPLGPYRADRAAAALARLPPPGLGTAIGDALQAARVALYRSGAIRKHILVVTDGRNTVSTPPERVAREIWRRSGGAVAISFVAFDTDPRAFAFIREVGGEVLAAGDPPGLDQALRHIYEGKILAEAVDDPAAPGRPR
jgi:Mg-chelatase subunit ChlD